jgi:hypothetical protein
MKKLNNLLIKSEKLLKNEELVSLRGGYDNGYRGYCCYGSSGGYHFFNNF